LPGLQEDSNGRYQSNKHINVFFLQKGFSTYSNRRSYSPSHPKVPKILTSRWN